MDTLRFRRRLVICGALTVVAAGLTVAVATAWPLHRQLELARTHQLASVTAAKAQLVAEVRRRQTERLHRLTSHSEARRLLAAHAAGRLDGAGWARATAAILDDAIRTEADVIGAVRVAAVNGRAVAVGVAIPPAVRVEAVLDDRARGLIGPINTRDGRVVLIAHAPVLGTDGHRLGTDVLVIDADDLIGLMSVGPGDPRSRLALWCGDMPSGRRLLVGPHADVPARITGLDALTPGAPATLPPTPVFTWGDAIIGQAAVPDSDWRVLWSRPRDAFYQDLSRLAARVGLIVLALTCAAIGAVVLLPRPLSGSRVVRAETLASVVAERTSEISDQNRQLVETNAEIVAARAAAEDAYRQLHDATDSLIESEKLAALGRMVGVIAHEVNTPVGATVTGASTLSIAVRDLERRYRDHTLSPADLETFLEDAREVCDLVTRSSLRAAELVKSFKQVAVDQASGERRRFDLADYIGEVLGSLRPILKKTPHEVIVDCPRDIVIDSYPGPLAQCLTNVVLNAVEHAFAPGQAGQIRLMARRRPDTQVSIAVADNGRGMPSTVQARVFEPFFTTGRHRGGSGLGMHIVHAMATGTLGGTVTVSSDEGRGTTVCFVLPTELPDPEPDLASELAQ